MRKENELDIQDNQTNVNQLIMIRLNEVVDSVEFTYEDVLHTILKSHLHISEEDGLDPLILDVTSRVDFKKFREDYCDGVCEGEYYFLYHYNQCSIQDLVEEWNFDSKKFCSEQVVPFLRNYKLNQLFGLT
jgi:hypothetical protein